MYSSVPDPGTLASLRFEGSSCACTCLIAKSIG
jgi:hypothetical protein